MLAGDLTANGNDPAIKPDFAVVSKGLTGGVLPLSAVLIPDEIYDVFWGDYFSGKAFMHSNTHTGNALAVAVANAACDVYAQDRVLDHVAQNGPLLRQGLQRLVDRRKDLGNLRQVGLVAAVDILGKRSTDRTGYYVYQAASRHGAWLRSLGDSMYLMPPHNASVEE